MFLRVTVTSLLLIWVFFRIDCRHFIEVLRSARWLLIIAVWASIALMYWINSFKMRLILRAQNCRLNTGTLFGISAVTSLYSLVVPGVLSMAVKWYFLKKGTGSGMRVFSSMVYNQASNVAIMAMFGLGVLIVTNPAQIIWSHERSQSLTVACSIILMVVFQFWLLLLNKKTGSGIVRAISVLLGPLPGNIRGKAQEAMQHMALFESLGWLFHLMISLITLLGTALIGVLMYFFAARAALITVPLSTLAWLWAVIYILQRVPVSIANLGVREVILLSVLPRYGEEFSSVVLMSLILFSALVFISVLGLLFQLIGFGTGVRPDEAGQSGSHCESRSHV
ncbi:MAG: flippase-like domain-containing protein [Deltaproteobacteria bacterium]|nr:flippase-like domain-containing protein [Deltaproteobacteria bacterium]